MDILRGFWLKIIRTAADHDVMRKNGRRAAVDFQSASRAGLQLVDVRAMDNEQVFCRVDDLAVNALGL